MNDKTLEAADKWLKELGITTYFPRRDMLAVDRNGVAAVLGGHDNENQVALMAELRLAVSPKLCWGGVGHNHTWMYLECF